MTKKQLIELLQNVPDDYMITCLAEIEDNTYKEKTFSEESIIADYQAKIATIVLRK